MLAELDKLEPTDERFETLLTKFTGDAREHIAFEETQAWPVLRVRISAEEAAELGEKLTAAKDSAPSRQMTQT